MEEQPRFHFVSITFVVGFGLGIFAGVVLALAAFAMVQEENPAAPVRAQAEPTATILSAEATITPTPDIRPRTKASLDVRLGPGTAFAVVGTTARGEAVEIVGRDASAGWAAIRFPPGSSARGWVPVAELDGATEIESAAVVLPTPLPRGNAQAAPFSPFSGGGRSTFNGDDGPTETTTAVPVVGTPGPGAAFPSFTQQFGTPTRGTPQPVGTPTPVQRTGPSDLVVTRASLTSDNRVLVTIGNRGPGDLTNKTVFVIVRDLTLKGEQLSTEQRLMTVGSVISVQTQGFQVTREMDIQIIVDPFSGVQDPDRSNNQTTVTLSPLIPPTPTRSPFE